MSSVASLSTVGGGSSPATLAYSACCSPSTSSTRSSGEPATSKKEEAFDKLASSLGYSTYRICRPCLIEWQWQDTARQQEELLYALESPSFEESPMHDVDVVQRILEYFLMHEQQQQNPQNARACHDGLYRAIDTYLKTHPTLTEHDRRRLCKAMDCEKLSFEACTHAAQNDRLPLRTESRKPLLSLFCLGRLNCHNMLSKLFPIVVVYISIMFTTVALFVSLVIQH